MLLELLVLLELLELLVFHAHDSVSGLEDDLEIEAEGETETETESMSFDSQIVEIVKTIETDFAD